MAISNAWTDVDTLEVAASGLTRASTINGMLGNQLFLHEAPQVAVRYTRDTGTIQSAQDTILGWDEAPWDNFGMWDNSAQTQIVVPRSGLYLINLGVLYQQQTDPTDDIRRTYLNVNGDRRRGDSNIAANPHESSTTWVTSLAEDDSLTLGVRQTSGEALTLQPLRTVCVVVWISEFFATLEVA